MALFLKKDKSLTLVMSTFNYLLPLFLSGQIYLLNADFRMCYSVNRLFELHCKSVASFPHKEKYRNSFNQMRPMIWAVPQAAERHLGVVLLGISLAVWARHLAFTDTSYQVSEK